MFVCMISLPLWYLTSDPLWAVVMTVRNIISIGALEHYLWTTVLFPAMTACVCLIFILMVIYRRVRK